MSKLPVSLLYLVAAGTLGVSLCWTVEMTLVTPFLEDALQAGTTVSHFVWVAGPVSGLTMAPVVGYLSDRRAGSRLGKRRPFVLGGCVLGVLGLTLFASARQIGAALGDSGAGPPYRVGTAVAVSSFATADFALNMMFFPLHALISDVTPPSQQHQVQSVAGALACTGDVIASASAAATAAPVTHIRLIFGFCCAVLAATVCVSLLSATSQRAAAMANARAADAGAADGDAPTAAVHVERGRSERRTNGRARRMPLLALQLLEGVPPRVWRIGAVYALCWFSLFTFMPSFSSWMGRDVYAGDPSAPRDAAANRLYQEGVARYSSAAIARALCGLAFSVLYPSVLRRVGVRALIGNTMFFLALLLLLPTVIVPPPPPRWLGMLTVALTGIPQAMAMSVPHTLIAESFPAERGTYLGALNVFCTLAQLVDTTYTGKLAAAVSESACLVTGAAWAAAAGVASFMLLERGSSLDARDEEKRADAGGMPV